MKTSVNKHAVGSIKKPRITEKATFSAEKGAYIFEIAQDATKITVAKAIEALYKVVPVKVNIVRTPAKKVFVRGKVGYKQAVKKAIVFLKKGDKIDLA
ncbi:MAG: ribosomal subunit protein large subunit ribosomal protein [Candidatus Parcubacteria bacterium]|jgi:large subunit ribosomal protein L23